MIRRQPTSVSRNTNDNPPPWSAVAIVTFAAQPDVVDDACAFDAIIVVAPVKTNFRCWRQRT
jgi:hypothetical protein